LFKTIRYQSRLSPDDWHRLHVCLDDVLYECCLDLRKCLKCSVSRIISDAIKEYSDDYRMMSFDSYRYFYFAQAAGDENRCGILLERRRERKAEPGGRSLHAKNRNFLFDSRFNEGNIVCTFGKKSNERGVFR
jgi:hypothetical protein